MARQPVNPRLNAAILEIVDTQLREGTPPETGQTFERLIAEGYSPHAARDLIGCVVVNEIVEVLGRSEPYDEARFVAALGQLPRLPWEHAAGTGRAVPPVRPRAGSTECSGRARSRSRRGRTRG